MRNYLLFALCSSVTLVFANPVNINDQSTIQAKACSLQSGKADSYVVAFSLQSGFCETFGYAKGKPECINLQKDSAYIRQFSLHGLWPNQNACGTNYGYCDNTQKETEHCNYKPLMLNVSVDGILKNYMPSYAFNSCLERHEWYKHGTCQLRNYNDYYDYALKLTSQINNSEIGNFLKVSTGKKVSTNEFYSYFNKSFGEGSSKKIKLICKENILVDIYVNLPNLDSVDQLNNYLPDLKTLISEGKDEVKPVSGCKSEFRLSDFSVN